MWYFEHDNLPQDVSNLFHYVQHDAAKTRSCTNNLARSRKIITETHGRNSLTFIGTKTSNELKLLPLFQAAKSKYDFVEKYKKFLLSC